MRARPPYSRIRLPRRALPSPCLSPSEGRGYRNGSLSLGEGEGRGEGGHVFTHDPGYERAGFQLLNRSRSTFLSNLPTLVFGTASMKMTSSGSHHLATRGVR